MLAAQDGYTDIYGSTCSIELEEGEHLTCLSPKPLKSCKGRVPTPFNQFKTAWLSGPLDKAVNAIKEPFRKAYSPMERANQSDYLGKIDEDREPEAPRVLKSCKGRIPTPFNPFKSEWL